jgi:hypothetical protein
MSKYNFTLKVLGEKMQEIGGELYALELVKKEKNGEAMAAIFGGLMGDNDNHAHFNELMEVMELLKKLDPPIYKPTHSRTKEPTNK